VSADAARDLASPVSGGSVIQEVACYPCSVPLPAPLLVGDMTVSRRTYDVIRIRTSDGLDGVGYAFGRGLPVTRIVEDAVAPLLIGADPAFPELFRARIASANWPYAERGLFSVAASAVDLALWDLMGKRLNAPVADLLGRLRDEVPICGVGGYARQGVDEIAALQEEMAGFVQLGCKAFKMTIGATDPVGDADRVAAVRQVVGDDATLVADAFRSFRSLEDALRRLRLLEPYDLSYVEDPFAESLAPLVRELRRRTGVLIGLGENLGGHRAFHELIEGGAVDVVRCDATVVGGVRELMAAASLASARGLELSTHVHPEVHVHFGAALGNLHPAGLEYMPPASGLNPFHELLATQLEVHAGRLRVPSRPGLGLDFDWQAVERYASV
jgi:L-alanine-DL-glutamate epimerase-like enolase superfamily enzyme